MDLTQNRPHIQFLKKVNTDKKVYTGKDNVFFKIFEYIIHFTKDCFDADNDFRVSENCVYCKILDKQEFSYKNNRIFFFYHKTREISISIEKYHSISAEQKQKQKGHTDQTTNPLINSNSIQKSLKELYLIEKIIDLEKEQDDIIVLLYKLNKDTLDTASLKYRKREIDGLIDHYCNHFPEIKTKKFSIPSNLIRRIGILFKKANSREPKLKAISMNMNKENFLSAL